ncbi:4-coumarate--CoA ligase 1-like isoform X2 [Ischnura elegans]|nr:4-coumarate--CoA ligase 1-like isoform X2 [Ischnura elegans]
MSIEEMLEHEDGSAFPKYLKINPKEDVLVIVNTSGSTGISKGVMQTHFSRVAYYKSIGLPKKLSNVSGSTMLAMIANYLTGAYSICMTCLLQGTTMYSISNFNPENLMEHIEKYKPDSLFLYPYAIHGFVHSASKAKADLSFLRSIMTGGAVINYSSAKALEALLPHVKLIQRYGASETQTLTLSDFGDPTVTKNTEAEGVVAGIKYKKLHGSIRLTCGYLLPLVEAKILDPVSGSCVGRNVPGNLLIKTSYMMKGYSCRNHETKEFLDKNGWFDTGDIAYFDDDGCLYVVDRSKFTFKYLMKWVSPAEVEAIILKHPDVLSVAVVGVPDPQITSAAKAFVVLKPESEVTEGDIKSHVAERAEVHKHLHGGVKFVDSLPVTAGGKLDRTALLKQAIADS